jgi:transglutaminase-like putative cysteine protease
MRFAALEHSRRDFIRAAGLGSAALLTSGLRPLSAAAYDPADCRLMEFDVSYRTEIASLPRDAKDVQIWMPLPSSDHAQQITGLDIVSPLPYDVTREARFGAKMLHVRAEPHSAPFAVEARYRVTRGQVGIQPGSLPENERSKYLQLTNTVRTTPEIDMFTEEIVGGETDPYEIGRLVFDGIREILFYDSSIPGCGTGDTAWIMRHKRGKCDDYHALFMAMMVSRGVPVRWEQGFPLPYPEGGAAEGGQLEGDCTGAHCWTSFYAPDHGWVPVDVSEGDKLESGGEFYFGRLSPNRFQVSVGRSVVLNPAQGGDPLSSFAFAYAESDGIPLIYALNYENIIKYTVGRVEMA